ncbi:hypothetical protein NLG97_g5055 [Lecanicillium saksenae]|uniref:Uncharacterized protein n=1 Tax=Lecanicillium saksenae TaxID=468837 RepID=A0ACC1QVF0_9HYPO|nr:hypothetical protein NLG97_g5055 [Lecanicillium saksenae]
MGLPDLLIICCTWQLWLCRAYASETAYWVPKPGDTVSGLGSEIAPNFMAYNTEVTDVNTISAHNTYTVLIGNSLPAQLTRTTSNGKIFLTTRGQASDANPTKTPNATPISANSSETGLERTHQASGVGTDMPSATTVSRPPTPILSGCHRNGTMFTNQEIINAAIKDFCSNAYNASKVDCFLSGDSRDQRLSFMITLEPPGQGIDVIPHLSNEIEGVSSCIKTFHLIFNSCQNGTLGSRGGTATDGHRIFDIGGWQDSI